MAIVDRYDGFVNYLYPILTNTSRQHRILRDTMLAAMLAQYRLFHAAGKSNQASRLYEADANAAYLKELLRVMADPARKLVSRRQYEVASVQPWQRGVNFCGYRIWPTHKLLRRSSVTRARRKLRAFAATGDHVARAQFLAAWRGHARHADTHNLLTHLGV